MNCGLSSLLAWIFHSDEHSQEEQKLCCFFPLTPVSLLQDGVPAFHSPFGKQRSFANSHCNTSNLHASVQGNKPCTVIFVLLSILQEMASFLEP